MFTFETMLLSGLALIFSSVITLAVAQHTRGWFFRSED